MPRFSVLFAFATFVANLGVIVHASPVPAFEIGAAAFELRGPAPNVASTDSTDRVLFLREPSAEVATANNQDRVLFLRAADTTGMLNHKFALLCLLASMEDDAGRVDAVFLRRGESSA
ncbi:hypothetical protein CPC08DRAFT_761548 [Agrocybe pediades]|nr:hypothetical protein CPC08DRAFT_761548 [Agrocybe pediades]